MSTVIMFPGQGSQSIGMGNDLWELFPEMVEKANQILGYDIVELCLNGESEKLDRTDYAQAAIYVVNAMVYRRWHAVYEQPSLVLGHSIGQYNAMLAAEMFTFSDGLKMVKKRGELMVQQEGGAMAAVMKISANEVKDILAQSDYTDTVDIANYNSEFQTVISGDEKSIEGITGLLQMYDAFVVRLNTSGAFHSRFMAQAKKSFEAYLSGFSFAQPQLPLLCNVTARSIQSPQLALAEHLTNPVLWADSIWRVLEEYPEAEFVECGSGKTLTNILRFNRKEFAENFVEAS